ncbi:transcription initiation factor IIE alpha subunit [Pseudomonas frederiksbergensis]|uniref:MarR family transcriptional regulator n=1 Tax=Pseudomonas TaxID=286 RepID=UPI003D256018
MSGHITDEVHAPIALTAEAGKLKTMTNAEMCRRTELSTSTVEIALAKLQEKGLVTGFIPRDEHALIVLSPEGDNYEI